MLVKLCMMLHLMQSFWCTETGVQDQRNEKTEQEIIQKERNCLLSQMALD